MNISLHNNKYMTIGSLVIYKYFTFSIILCKKRKGKNETFMKCTSLPFMEENGCSYWVITCVNIVSTS